jgi:hypothetical protein
MNKKEIVGGELQFPTLTRELATADRKEYDLGLLEVTIEMMNDGIFPTKFYNPTKKGTRAAFKTIQDQREFAQCKVNLKLFVENVNMLYGTNVEVSAEPREEKHE